MKGVEILASNNYVIERAFDWKTFLYIFIILFGLSLLVGFVISKVEDDFIYLFFFLIIGLVCGLFVGWLYGDIEGTPTKYETEYKVTISDDVSMNEFYEKYEIIDQEGSIYTIREREGR